MAKPGSDARTFKWLLNKSALGSLTNVNFKQSSVMSLYRACDELYKKHDEIETLIWNNLSINANYDITIALYDLTNTYFEGNPNNDDA
jgi:hypothetical protein